MLRLLLGILVVAIVTPASAQHNPIVISAESPIRLTGTQSDSPFAGLLDALPMLAETPSCSFAFEELLDPTDPASIVVSTARAGQLGARYAWARDVEHSGVHSEFPARFDIFGVSAGVSERAEPIDDGYGPALVKLVIVPLPLAFQTGLAGVGCVVLTGLAGRQRRGQVG